MTVTLTPASGSPGAPQTFDDPTTGGLAPALQAAARSGGGFLQVGPTTIPVATTLAIPSNVELQFQGTTLRKVAPPGILRTNPGTKNVRITGTLTVDGGNQPERFFYAVGTDGYTFQAATEIRAMGLPFSLLLIRGSQNVKVLGPFRSVDSAVVRVVDSSQVEVANVDCVYSRDPGEVPVGVFGSAPMTNIEIHHLHINGGGLRPRPMVDLSPDPGAPHIRNVSLHDISLENPPTTTDFHDGIDVDRADGVLVQDVQGTRLNLVLCLMSSNAQVRRVTGTECWGPALQVGDPKFMKEDAANVVVENCSALDSGRGYQGPAGAGMGVYCTPGRKVSNVVFRGCTSRDTHHVQKYGFGVMAGASGVRVEGCDFEGTEAGVLNQAGAQNLVLVSTKTSP